MRTVREGTLWFRTGGSNQHFQPFWRQRRTVWDNNSSRHKVSWATLQWKLCYQGLLPPSAWKDSYPLSSSCLRRFSVICVILVQVPSAETPRLFLGTDDEGRRHHEREEHFFSLMHFKKIHLLRPWTADAQSSMCGRVGRTLLHKLSDVINIRTLARFSRKQRLFPRTAEF